ncbi:MAG TPA: DoxX family protein [Mycobacteriales bacterium]|nr:DoxX family protein [Mycobacteriales bacterium]
MSLPRHAARVMLAALFIEGGIRQLRNPEPLTPKAEPVTGPITDAIEPLPDDTAQLVRIDGAVKVAGGVLLAVGPLHRPAALALAGSLVPTTLAGHRFWDEPDPATRREQEIHFLKNMGLLGGLLLASLDTGGRPSVPWMTRQIAHRTADGISSGAEHAATATRDSVTEAAAALVATAGALGTAARRAAPGGSRRKRRNRVLAALPLPAGRRRHKRRGHAADAALDALSHGRDRVRDQARRVPDVAAQAASYTADRVQHAAAYTADRAVEVGSRAADRAVEVGSRAADRAAEVGSRAADRAADVGSRAAERASERAAELGSRAVDRAADLSSRAAERAQDLGSRATARAAERAHDAAGKAHDAASKAQDAAGHAKHRVLSR